MKPLPHRFLIAVLLAAAVPVAAQEPPEVPGIDHGAWADFLGAYVCAHRSGVSRMDYAAVTTGHREHLDRYVEALQAVPISSYGRDQRMAYWINLYNALTVRVILEHYPVASITHIDLTPPSDGPWDAKLATVEGRELSLNAIENEVLRAGFEDPRIHYAINCASFGCPNLAGEPFVPEDLDERLDRVARDFVNHPRGARFEDGRLVVSSIYVWFREDFGGSDEGVVEHLRRYATGELAAGLAGYSGELTHGYDWNLNAP